MIPPPPSNRARYESFGGIISSTDSEPPFLAWVDQDFMREMGHAESPKWSEPNPKAHLSAPTEVHFSVTNKCSAGCKSCYMNSSKSFPEELSTSEMKKHMDTLREMGVFHVALGGGEAFERLDFEEIVDHMNSIGLVPNLTTNAQNIGPHELRIIAKMGQVNVSLDGVGDRYGVNGRQGSFLRAEAALVAMKKIQKRVGINCVVSGKSYPYMAEVIEFADQLGLNEVEFLRFKPQGRGKAHYLEHALTQEMMRDFYPTLLRIRAPFSVPIKIDCSFVPALVYHNPPREELEKLAVTGCDAGNLLLAVKSDGRFSGCSFVSNSEPISEIRERWDSSTHLNGFRDLVAQAPEPCRSCDYLSICRTGCRAVALHLAGDFSAADPECPKVFDHARSK